MASTSGNGDLNAAAKYQRGIEGLMTQNPHADDPRCMQNNQANHCALRYAVFARCAKELGDEHARCRYQFYRAQIACANEQIELWEEYRSKGKCPFSTLPEYSTKNMYQ